ncbi:unnamed protein product [Paramecium sonneborni]|uniref:Uncharacterized protein n=1 Tax=Paramecium sonneborni TaxID=65129 RepID=A0A8S1NBQ2_9CILI|nr:unnamed protein product [Paramecium sonneborni]
MKGKIYTQGLRSFGSPGFLNSPHISFQSRMSINLFLAMIFRGKSKFFQNLGIFRIVIQEHSFQNSELIHQLDYFLQ